MVENFDVDTNEQFVLRTPLLRIKDLVSTEEALLEAFQKPLIREALYVGSKDLYHELLQIEKGEVKDKAKRDKICAGLYKYYTRMCTRCTPFGLFAGLNVGSFDDVTDIKIGEKIQPKGRLDMDYLCNLYYELNKDVTLYPYLIFHCNNSLYKVQRQWRYIEYQFKENTVRFHNLVSIDDNEVLSKLIDVAKEGCSYNQLRDIITAFDFEEEEATQYLTELIKSQVLVSSLYPSISGQEYQFRLLSELEKLPGEKFKGLNSQLGSILHSGDSFISKTIAIEKFLSRFDVAINSNHLIQVDLLKEVAECKLSKTVKAQIAEATDIVSRLMKPSKNSDLLDKFKTAYYERYEDVFMPLAHIMDTDIGIGYKDAISISAQMKSRTADIQDKAIRRVKMKLFSKSLSSHQQFVELNEADLQGLKAQREPMPNSFSFMGSLLRKDDDQIIVRYKSAGGSSAVNLIGRFGHLHKDFEALSLSLTKEEDDYYSNAILAEIVHLPQGRIGNVVTRPHFRKYEIPYLSLSTLPAENQVSVDDLYVGVVNFRVVLYSKRLNKEVIPRLGNAHNFQSDSLPLYHFLCDLQLQNTNRGIYWSWDELYDEEFLPRVTYKNIILTPARWNISTAAFSKLNFERDSDSFYDEVQRIGLPDKIIIPQGDNELYLDLRTHLGASVFLKSCKKSERIIIEEFLFSAENGFDGYTNEIIVPFLKGKPNLYSGVENVRLQIGTDQFHSPLSEWVYFKIYTGKKYIDRLLLEAIPNLVEQLKRDSIISKWFFIRYTDPNPHLRLRFHLYDKSQKDVVLNQTHCFLDEFIADHIIWDLQIGTYKREVDRYGGDTIVESESWFYNNSEMVLKLLPVFKSLVEKDQLTYAIYCIDRLLNQFRFNLEEKAAFASLQSGFYNNEFGVSQNKALKIKLNDDFRANHNFIKNILHKNYDDENAAFHNVTCICENIEQHTQCLIQSVINIHNLNRMKLASIIASYVHMFINRLFNNGQRYKEMLIYYFMEKYYASEIARNKVLMKAGHPLHAAISQ